MEYFLNLQFTAMGFVETALLHFILTLRAQVNSYSVSPFGTRTYLLGNTEPAPSHIPPTKLEDKDTAAPHK